MNRHAFTLIELLVVLVIIIVVAGLITFGASNTNPHIRWQARITLEIHQLGSAIEDFKAEFGAYPPNSLSNSIQRQSNQQASIPEQDILQMFKRAFPRNLEPKSLILGLAGKKVNSGNNESLQDGMTENEVIFFWLGGFSQDPQYPLSNLGGPSFSDAEGNNDGVLDAQDERLEARNMRYDFDRNRLGPRTRKNLFDDSGLTKGGGQFIEYDDPRNGTRRRINLWQYRLGRSEVPVAYFDTSRHTPSEYYPVSNPLQEDGSAPLRMLREGTVSTNAESGDFQFVNQGKFQILHAGLDDVWGDFSDIRSGATVFPSGPFVGSVADTLSNFSVSTLEDAQE